MTKIILSNVDCERLANLLKLAEHAIGLSPKTLVPFTGEDIALAQRFRKLFQDKNEYFVITNNDRKDSGI